MAKQKFIMATFVSRSWEWRGFGKTYTEAQKALEEAMDAHCKGTPGYVKEDFYHEDDIAFLDFSIGDGFRDYNKMN